MAVLLDALASLQGVLLLRTSWACRSTVLQAEKRECKQVWQSHIVLLWALEHTADDMVKPCLECPPALLLLMPFFATAASWVSLGDHGCNECDSF